MTDRCQRVATAAAPAVEIELPLPDGRIGPNGRADRWEKSVTVKRLRWSALQLTREAIEATGLHWWEWEPWPAARVDIEWRYAGTQPDQDNCIARCKGAIDGAADALGMNDRHISIGTIALTHTTRALQGVVLTFTRIAS